jgi:hypothetical protein
MGRVDEPTNGLIELRNHLISLPPGTISVEASKGVEKLLIDAWPKLKIRTDDEHLERYKLGGRTENLAWNPPHLTFDIERHGATVQGSSRAHVHSWTVDVREGTAGMALAGTRQVRPMDKPVKVQPIAEEIAALIRDGKQDPRLEWKSHTDVRVLISVIFPATNQQTTAGRRKRFRVALDAFLIQKGWTPVGANRYRLRRKIEADST